MTSASRSRAFMANYYLFQHLFPTSTTKTQPIQFLVKTITLSLSFVVSCTFHGGSNPLPRMPRDESVDILRLNRRGRTDCLLVFWFVLHFTAFSHSRTRSPRGRDGSNSCTPYLLIITYCYQLNPRTFFVSGTAPVYGLHPIPLLLLFGILISPAGPL